MNNDLEVFENRSDDWLAKERKYESSISAWDLDEGKKMKAEHEENCEADYLKEAHHKKHEEYNETHNRGVVKDNNQFQTMDTSIIKRFVLISLLITVFFIVIVIASEFEVINLDEIGFAIPIIIFIILANLTTNKKRRK